jgi:hypothetical protein
LGFAKSNPEITKSNLGSGYVACVSRFSGRLMIYVEPSTYAHRAHTRLAHAEYDIQFSKNEAIPNCVSSGYSSYASPSAFSIALFAFTFGASTLCLPLDRTVCFIVSTALVSASSPTSASTAAISVSVGAMTSAVSTGQLLVVDRVVLGQLATAYQKSSLAMWE